MSREIRSSAWESGTASKRPPEVWGTARTLRCAAVPPINRTREYHFNQRYLAFLTEDSRTADIERVLALGVHGPLELHILLLEDN